MLRRAVPAPTSERALPASGFPLRGRRPVRYAVKTLRAAAGCAPSRLRMGALRVGLSPSWPRPVRYAMNTLRAMPAPDSPRGRRNITALSRSCCGVFPHAIAATSGNITARFPPFIPRRLILASHSSGGKGAPIAWACRAHPVAKSRLSGGGPFAQNIGFSGKFALITLLITWNDIHDMNTVRARLSRRARI